MTVLSGEFLPFSFKGHMHAMCDMYDFTFFIAKLKPKKQPIHFFKRVTKEIMIINMKVEDKDVHVHFLYSWLEIQYVCSSHQLKIFLTIPAAI